MAIATPAASELDDLIAASQGPMFSMFYVVSQRKLAILFLSTYTACHKRKHPEASRFGSTISPAVRAASSLFFTHALFRKVKAHGRGQPLSKANWAWVIAGGVLWVLILVGG
jgi:hypothetical protein